MRDLAGKIGISQAMLFAYRSGKSEPTLKAFKKLEAAELAAGLGEKKPGDVVRPAEREGKAKEFPGGETDETDGMNDEANGGMVVRDGGSGYDVSVLRVLREQLEAKDRQIARLLGMLEKSIGKGKAGDE